MNVHAEKQASFLFRLRSQDTPTGVSGETLDALMQKTGLSKTEVTHLALRSLADAYLPHYGRDEGALTTAQIQKIREASTSRDVPEESYTMTLF
ncbi:hypothetical protein OHJ28_07855 [Dickeya fangzhongdai]|uniref:hypothetical protein n=1 Tax=Dickeya fangzhongdai TaxID=1778540 RepID=UPI003306AC25